MSNYQASNREQALDIINLDNLEQLAQQVIPAPGFAYISGGSEDLWTMHRNRQAFDQVQIVPNNFADLEKPELTTSLFGIQLNTPVFMSPAAAHGLAHQQAEAATARGLALAGALFMQSNYSSVSIEEQAQAGNPQQQFFQIYLSQDMELNQQMIKRAEAAQLSALVITTDTSVLGYREQDKIYPFEMELYQGNFKDLPATSNFKSILDKQQSKISLSLIKEIISMTKLPVVIKGIQSVTDALIAIEAGAAAIQVSNHGGRQLNGAPGSFDCLYQISQAVNGQVKIIFDSGVRRGSHVFKALANGADLVGLSRPLLYALGLGGAAGVASAIAHLNFELAITMQLAGCKNIAEVKNNKLLGNI